MTSVRPPQIRFGFSRVRGYQVWLKMSAGVLFISLALLLPLLQNSTQPAEAAINEQLNFQARLLNDDGSLVNDGFWNVRFRIYCGGDGDLVGAGSGTDCNDTENEELLWTETHDYNGGAPDNRVRVANGYISVQLNSLNNDFSNIDWNEDELWLTIDIGGNTTSPSWDGEMDPFIRFTSVPYAFNADQLDGLDSTDLVQIDQGEQAVNSGNTLIRIDQAGAGDLIDLQVSNSSVFQVSNAGNLTLGGNATVQGGTVTAGSVANTGSLVIHDNDGSGGETVTITTPDISTSYTLTLPTNDGASDQCLKSDGSGVLSFENCNNGSGSGGSITLQDAYDAGNTISTDLNGTVGDIAFTLANTATDRDFTITTASGATGFTSISRADGAGTADPPQLLLIEDLETDRSIADGIVVRASNIITDGIDVSDAELTNAINIGANAISGTNFNVTGAGAIVGVGLDSGTGLIQGTGGLTVGGTITLSSLDCSGNGNGGALTADASGLISCSDDDGGAGGAVSGTGAAGQVSYWSGVSTQTGSNGLTWDNTNGVLQVMNISNSDATAPASIELISDNNGDPNDAWTFRADNNGLLSLINNSATLFSIDENNSEFGINGYIDSSLEVRNPSVSSGIATLHLSADNNEQADDRWTFQAEDGGLLSFINNSTTFFTVNESTSEFEINGYIDTNLTVRNPSGSDASAPATFSLIPDNNGDLTDPWDIEAGNNGLLSFINNGSDILELNAPAGRATLNAYIDSDLTVRNPSGSDASAPATFSLIPDNNGDPTDAWTFQADNNGPLSFINNSNTRFNLNGSSGTLTLGAYDCTGNANGGALTANASGVISCTDDDGGGTGEFTDTGTLLHPADLSGAEDIAIGGTTTGTADILLQATGGAIFNQQGANADFRVEGDTEENLLFVDASADSIGIGTSAPRGLLDVSTSDSGTDIYQYFGYDASHYFYWLYQGSGNGNDNELELWTEGDGGADVQVIEIEQDGEVNFLQNVGIGDASPASALTVGSGDLFQVNSSGAIQAATGITSSGTITFSGLTTCSGLSNGGKLTTDGGGNVSCAADVGGGTGEFTDTGTLLHPADLSGAEDIAIGGTTTGTADILLQATGGAIFNQQGANANFRVEASGQANALFVQGSDGNIGIGTASPDGRLEVSGGLTQAAWGANGIQLQVNAATYTDSSTAGSGTAASAVFNSFGQPTLAASNTSVTTTDAATVYIQNAPAAGTNQTITNSYALWVDDGNVRVDDRLFVGSGNNLISLGKAGVDGIISANILDADHPTGNPEFRLHEAGTQRAKFYYDVAANRFVFQNNETGADDAIYIAESFTSTGSGFIEGGTLGVGTTSQAGAILVYDGNGQRSTILSGDQAANRNITIPTTSVHDILCLENLNNCAGSAQDLFQTIDAPNGTDPVADSATDTLSFLDGSGITITGDSGADSITIASVLGADVDSSEIVNGTIGEVDLNISNAESSGWLLSSDGAGGFTWVNPAGVGDVPYILVAANDSPTYIKNQADYVADGTDDQVEINNALTAAAGGKVVLAEGKFITHQTDNGDASILIPNNTTLTGEGPGTVIELGDIDASENIIENSDTSTGTGVVVRNLKLDGRDDLNTIGGYDGIHFDGMGANTREGGTIDGVKLQNINGEGIYLTNSFNNNITRNTIWSTNNSGIELDNNSSYNNISNNIVNDNGPYAILLTQSPYNTVTGNTVTGGGGNRGISSSSALGGYNTITGNTIEGMAVAGIYLTSPNNVVAGNNIVESGGSTLNDGIYLGGADGNLISGNYISDSSCSSTCYAINISNSISDNNYLADNTFDGTATINDSGTGTIYANQLNGGVDQAGSDLVIQVPDDVNINSDIVSTGSLTFSGVATDLTTASGEDLTVVANGAGIVHLNDTVRIGSLDCSALGNGGKLTTNGSGDIICDADTGGGSAVTLQDAYDNSTAPATITTADNKNIEFNLADTTTDSDFIVNLLGTGNVFDVQDGGSSVFTVSDGGRWSVDGTAEDVANGTIWTFDGTIDSTTNDQTGLLVAPTISPGAASTQDYAAITGNPITSTTNLSGSSATITGVLGVGQYNGSGTLNGINGLLGRPINASTGTVTYTASLYAANPANLGGGTIDTAYGLYIEDISAGGTSNYNIRSLGASSINSFEGDILVGGNTAGSSDIVLDSNGSAVFNEQGNDSDFRVAGQTVANLLFGDASTNRVGIGINDPSYDLTVSDPDGSGGTIISALHTSGSGDFINLDVTGASGTIRFGSGYTGNTISVGNAGDLAFDFGGGSSENIVFRNAGGAIFNQQLNDSDFVVSGDTDANLLFVDASTDRVGIGTNAPGAVLGVAGDAQFTAASDTASIFRVQDAGGQDYLTVDSESATDALQVRVGAGTDDVLFTLDSFTAEPTGTIPDGAMFYDSDDNSFKCRINGSWTSCDTTGSGGLTLRETLYPEYAGGTFHADGSNNSGTLSADYDSTDRHNYYEWTSTQSSLQDYDIVVHTTVPSDFVTANDTSWYIYAYASDYDASTDNEISVAVYEGATQCNTTDNIIADSDLSADDTWTEVNLGSMSGCTLNANDTLRIEIKLSARNDGSVDELVRVGSIRWDYDN